MSSFRFVAEEGAKFFVFCFRAFFLREVTCLAEYLAGFFAGFCCWSKMKMNWIKCKFAAILTRHSVVVATAETLNLLTVFDAQGPVVQKAISLIEDYLKFCGQNHKDVDKDVCKFLFRYHTNYVMFCLRKF